MSILFFVLAALLLIAGGFFIYYGVREENAIGLLSIPTIGFAVISITAGVNLLNPKDAIQEIKCSEYSVETIITTSSKGQVDTTYVIQYKIK